VTVDYNSKAYKGGEIAGYGHQIVMGGAGLVSSVRAVGVVATAEGFSVATGAPILGINAANRIDPSGWTSAIILNAVTYVLPFLSRWLPKPKADPVSPARRYIPRDDANKPLPMSQQRVKGEDIPLPDPRAEGASFFYPGRFRHWEERFHPSRGSSTANLPLFPTSHGRRRTGKTFRGAALTGAPTAGPVFIQIHTSICSGTIQFKSAGSQEIKKNSGFQIQLRQKIPHPRGFTMSFRL